MERGKRKAAGSKLSRTNTSTTNMITRSQSKKLRDSVEIKESQPQPQQEQQQQQSQSQQNNNSENFESESFRPTLTSERRTANDHTNQDAKYIDENECAICLDEINENQLNSWVWLNGCKLHRFCVSCINQWVQRRYELHLNHSDSQFTPTCPSCLQSFNQYVAFDGSNKSLNLQTPVSNSNSGEQKSDHYGDFFHCFQVSLGVLNGCNCFVRKPCFRTFIETHYRNQPNSTSKEQVTIDPCNCLLAMDDFGCFAVFLTEFTERLQQQQQQLSLQAQEQQPDPQIQPMFVPIMGLFNLVSPR